MTRIEGKPSFYWVPGTKLCFSCDAGLTGVARPTSYIGCEWKRYFCSEACRDDFEEKMAEIEEGDK